MEKETIEVEVGENAKFTSRYNLPVDKLIKLFTERKAKGATHIDIWLDSDEGFILEFNKVREETDEEAKARIEGELEWERARKEGIEKKEREEYERLKKRFESN